jgi:flavorubredoxin
MSIKEVTSGIFSVGAIDWDRRLFDELIPLPQGTSYNSYLVKGTQKTALIDTVDPAKEQVLIDHLNEAGVKSIDYVISNHAEQDHSGTIPRILELYPSAKVVTNPKCKALLMDFLLIPDEKFITVNDNDTVTLGDKTIQFIIAPWVHWPETMLSYAKEDRVLFSCDLFGSHLATSELFVKEECDVYEPAKRYYAEIMMPFRSNIKKHLERIMTIPLDIIAPSHGPLHKKTPFILDAYRDWVSDEVKNEVVIPFVSMHGSTRKMVEHLVDALISRGISVKPFNLAQTDIGELAISLVDAATLVIASPTVLVGPHPVVVSAAYLANALRPKLRFVGLIGSYGWGSRMVGHIKDMVTNIQAEVIKPVVIKGYPKEQDIAALDALADEIMKRHKELQIIGKESA